MLGLEMANQPLVACEQTFYRCLGESVDRKQLPGNGRRPQKRAVYRQVYPVVVVWGQIDGKEVSAVELWLGLAQ